ncbi:MAG: LysM peptidoglycan-binding domain-containing protein [Anaerolineae bacterium]|nr:LysM peptidoglycan-binding domain-containing protein [Anaerolineae bacterium]MDQ7035027.1 LysM peptidoglycan-binding domain-containing protein [Anaerolineae bacterium]
MNEQRLTEVFNDCVDRMAMGQSLEDCLALYSDLADELRSLLQVGQLSRQARVDTIELSQVRFRLDKTITDYIAATDFNDSASRWRVPPGATVLSLAAAMMLVFGILLVLRDNSVTLTSSTATQTATATSSATNMPTETITQSASPSPTSSATNMPAATATMPPSPTSSTTNIPTETATSSATNTPTETATMTSSPTVTSSATRVSQTMTHTPSSESTVDAQTATAEAILSAQTCEATMPEDWTEYRVQTGDTLSFIALQSGTTTEILRTVNCIESGHLIIVGQTLFVPRLLAISTPDVVGTDSDSTVMPTSINQTPDATEPPEAVDNGGHSDDEGEDYDEDSENSS